MAAKFFTGLPLDGPDPECVVGYGEQALANRGDAVLPKPIADHSRSIPLIVLKPKNAPVPACAEDPLAGFDPNEIAVSSLSR